MTARQHHAFGVPQSAGHFCTPRRSRTPGADRKAKSRPLVKAGGGVVPVTLTSLEDAAYWLTEVEGFACEPTRENVGRAMSEYAAFRIRLELEELLRGTGRA